MSKSTTWQYRHKKRWNEYQRETRKSDPKRYKAYARKHYLKHRKKIISAACAYSRTHRKQANASQRKWYYANLDHARKVCRERTRKWRTRNPDHQSDYYQRNKAVILKRTGRYQRMHPKEMKAWHRKWRLKHPLKYRAYAKAKAHRYMARKRNASVGDKQVDQVIRGWHLLKRFKCTYCAKSFSTDRLSIDHIWPISKGGKHTVSNICRSCKPCNSQKRDRTDWKKKLLQKREGLVSRNRLNYQA